jgi:hypothetical protein
MSEHRAGDLTARGFRVDVPSADVSEAEIAALFVASLGLLMTDTVELSNVEVLAESHRARGEGRRVVVVTRWPRADGWSSSAT